MVEPIGLDRDRLSVVTGVLVLSLALARLFEAPVRPLATSALGSRLGINLTAAAVMLLISTGLAVTGVESLVRSHPRARAGRLRRSFMYWTVPALLIIALSGWLSTIEELGLWTLAVLAASLPIPLALAAEYHAVDPEERSRPFLHWAQTALIHLVAVALFTLIYDLRARSLLSGTGALVVGLLLAGRMFWASIRDLRRAYILGGAVGLLVGQMTWTLNYGRFSSLQGGLLVWLLFYVVTGLIQQSTTSRASRQVVLEYLGLAGLALLAIAFFSP